MKQKKKQSRKTKKSTYKNIGSKNKSNKIAKNCWLSRYKRSTSSKINYIFLPPKKKKKKE